VWSLTVLSIRADQRLHKDIAADFDITPEHVRESNVKGVMHGLLTGTRVINFRKLRFPRTENEY
jgi:hypothetical protein